MPFSYIVVHLCLQSCRACICICIGSYDVWLLGHCSSELPKIQLPFLWWRLLRNSPMALVLHSGFSSDDFHFLAILCGRSDLLEELETLWSYWVGYRYLQRSGTQGIQVRTISFLLMLCFLIQYLMLLHN